MLSAKAKLTIGIVLAICWVVAYISATAGWYRDCLNVSKGTGYLITLLPLIVGIMIVVLLGLEILPVSLSDEVYAIGSFVASLLLFITVVLQITGQCAPNCDVNEYAMR